MTDHGGISRTAALAAAATLALSLALAAPVAASPVIVVGEPRTTIEEDPFLPPPEATVPAPDLVLGPATAADATGGLAPGGVTDDPRPGNPSERPPNLQGRYRIRSVKGAVVQALEHGVLGTAQAERYVEIYDEARRVAPGLSRRCRNQLRYAIGVIESVARRGLLSRSRMPTLFLTLHRNTEFWSKHPGVARGARVRFAGTRLIWEHYAGQGLQLQPLANFGKINGLYQACTGVDTPREPHCPRVSFHRMLREIAPMASVRGSFVTWEYFFHFNGGVPPWTSGMAQASALQALARGGRFFERADWTALAGEGLDAFRTPPPMGVRVNSHGGSHYLIYSFAPGLRVGNAFTQSLIGLFDYYNLTHDRRALPLIRAGNRALRAELPKYDTGDWSRYSLGGADASLSYHDLMREFLVRLCRRTKSGTVCRYSRTFARYLGGRHPPENGGHPGGGGPRCGV